MMSFVSQVKLMVSPVNVGFFVGQWQPPAALHSAEKPHRDSHKRGVGRFRPVANIMNVYCYLCVDLLGGKDGEECFAWQFQRYRLALGC